MQVFSYSRLDKFCRCPAAFYESYVLERPEPATEPLELGRAVHAVIEAALKSGRSDEAFFRVMSGVVAGMLSIPIDPEEIFRLAYQSIQSKAFELGEEGRVEDHFQVPLFFDDPFSPELQGYIDCWVPNNDEVQLIDWKTNRKMYDPLDTYQLGLYAGWLYQKTGLPVRGKLAFLRFGEVREHLYTPENGIAEAWEWAQRTATDIRERLYALQSGEDPKTLFPTQPGDACVYCAWADHCTGFELDIPDIIRDQEKAVALGREILRLERRADILKGRLRAWVKSNGPVTVGSRQFRIVPSQYWKWPQGSLKNAVAAMEQEGIDPFTVLSLTSAGLKKLNWDEERIRTLGATLQSREDFRHVVVK